MKHRVPLVFHANYRRRLPGRDRKPVTKFAALYQSLEQQLDLQADLLLAPQPAATEVLALAHCPDYIQRFLHNGLSAKELRRIGLHWSEVLLERVLLSMGGACLAAEQALDKGIACHLAGGGHHAFYDYGSGYCVLNDLAIAALYMLATAKVQRVLVLDCDVHQGDGSAAILARHRQVFTCSVHAADNFPRVKQQSDRDIGLPRHCTDDEYLFELETLLPQLMLAANPQLVLYDAGVDVHGSDRLGYLDLTDQGIRRRDALVFEFFLQRGVAVATVTGGGYFADVYELGRRHALTVLAANQALTNCWA